MKKTVLITGGCGFIGTNTALKLIENNYKVIVFDSLVRKYSEENAVFLDKQGIEIIRGDIRFFNDLNKLPKCDYIIHLAGNAGLPWSVKWPVYDFQVNALGTVNVLEYARKNNTPVIFSSTNKVYSDEINAIPVIEKKTRYVWSFSKSKLKNVRSSLLEGISKKGINENFPMDNSGKFAHTPYGVSKASADLYCQEYFQTYKLPVVINRMACVFGLFQKGVEEQGWLDWFIRAKINNNQINIFGNGKQVRDELWGEDLSELFLRQLRSIKDIAGEVFNVGGGIDNSISLLEAINYLNSKGGQKMKIKYGDWRLNDQIINITDNQKVNKILKWKPKTKVLEGIDLIWNDYIK